MAQTTTLNFNVIGQSLERLDNNKIVEKAKNYVEVQFSFNEVWENTTKAILIEGSNLKYKVYLNEENKCLIPNRVVRHDGFTLNVVGEDNEKFITITTNDLFIPILSNRVEDNTPKYVEIIESNTLDVTRDGETYNLEIPDKYLELYVMQENDFSNMEHESGGDWTLDISETLESIIRAFEKRISVDWVTLGLEPPFPNMKKSVYIPTKQVTIMSDDEEILYYIYSATDGYGDTNIAFYYANATWHCVFNSFNLIDRETFNLGLESKQDVLQEGDGIEIENNTIKTKFYRHTTKIDFEGHQNGTIWVDAILPYKEAFTNEFELLEVLSKYKVPNSIKIYIDDTGDIYDMFVSFGFDAGHNNFDFDAYGRDEDNIPINQKFGSIDFGWSEMEAYTPIPL